MSYSTAALHRIHSWLGPAKWTGTLAGIAGAILVALNLEVSGYGFLLFLASSLLWCAAGIAQRDDSLILLQATFVVINIIGIYRWLVV
jgi:drug/metabolite transporter (DMT)-like permease